MFVQAYKMRYSTEAEFVINLQRSFRETQSLLEVNAGHGIADLAWAKFNKRHINHRLKLGQETPLLREEYFQILRNLPDIDYDKSGVSIDHLTTKTKIPFGRIKYKLVKDLINSGYVKEIDKGFYMKVNGWVPLVQSISAVEAKLTNWKSGIYQAIRYKSFANAVYLAVPVETINNVDTKLLDKFNIGLVTMLGNRRKVIKEVILENPQNYDKFNLVAEYFWKEFLNNRLTTT